MLRSFGSDYTKAKISFSQRRIWRERLKQKQSAENFFKSWTDNIALLAKIGWIDQGNLEWDSYDKIKEEIILQHLHQRAEKEKIKNMARLRAQRAAEAKALKMTVLAQKRMDREEKRKQKDKTKKTSCRQMKKKRHGDAVAQGINLKKRLLKVGTFGLEFLISNGCEC